MFKSCTNLNINTTKKHGEIGLECHFSFSFSWEKEWNYACNFAFVVLHPFRQAIWGHIWQIYSDKCNYWGRLKPTVEKRPTNAASVTLHPPWPWHASRRQQVQLVCILRSRHLNNTQQVVSRIIWIHTVESKTIATNVLLHALTHTIWGDILKHTVEMQSVWICILASRPFEDTFDTQWRIVNQMQPMWLYIILGRQLEDTFENTRWRKVKQMQPVQFCIISGRELEDTFKNTLWRKVWQKYPPWQHFVGVSLHYIKVWFKSNNKL